LALPTVRELVGPAAEWLGARGVPSPRLDADRMLAQVLGLQRLDLYLDLERPLIPSEVDAFRELVRRRGRREPLAYVLGSWSFRGLELAVDARVLVPRPETEWLVERALARIAEVDAPKVVDVGTGSGAIALALKHERPDLEVLGTDLSSDALAVARANARMLGLDVTFVQGDLLDAVSGDLDAVLSNPPYVAKRDLDTLEPEVIAEPDVAVFGGHDGFEIVRRLVPAAVQRAPLVAIEVGMGMSDTVGGMLRDAGATEIEVERDLAGIERVVVSRR
jgi:release factor glutamine methyltransferase